MSDVVGGLCTLVAELNKLRSDSIRVLVFEVPLLPMYSPEMRQSAKNINEWLEKVSVVVGFHLTKLHKSLLDKQGTVMPQWLISRLDVHLNAEGYRVFARHLRSIIMEGLYVSKKILPSKRNRMPLGIVMQFSKSSNDNI